MGSACLAGARLAALREDRASFLSMLAYRDDLYVCRLELLILESFSPQYSYPFGRSRTHYSYPVLATEEAQLLSYYTYKEKREG